MRGKHSSKVTAGMCFPLRANKANSRIKAIGKVMPMPPASIATLWKLLIDATVTVLAAYWSGMIDPSFTVECK